MRTQLGFGLLMRIHAVAQRENARAVAAELPPQIAAYRLVVGGGLFECLQYARVADLRRAEDYLQMSFDFNSLQLHSHLDRGSADCAPPSLTACCRVTNACASDRRALGGVALSA